MAGQAIIMLDNRHSSMKNAAVLLSGRVKLEASGGINLNKVRSVAQTGVDYISIGALTHSYKGLDFSLEMLTA
jgi:nicotinate-nucleotide pyrophosphorylase (carboxylating)